MANYDATSGSYTTRLTVTETGTNTANNTSTVQFSLTLIKNSGTGLWNNDSCPWSININGTSYSGSFTYDFRNYSSLTLKGSTNQTVTHNGDGSKKIAVSASVNMDNTPYVYTMSPSGTLVLTTIPRASDVTVSNYSITNTSGSLSATITSKANFYHKWRWRMNSGTWSSWTNKGLISTTSSTVTVANTTLLAQLPTATSGSFNIEVATYSDSGYANHVGTKSATCTVSVNTSNIKPSVSLGNIGLNSSPISGYAVAGYSKVQSAWTTTNSSGATSVTTYFTVSTGSLATTSSSSTSGTVVSNVIPSNASNYTLTIYAYAKDSRGAVGATVSKSITVYGYQPPTANLSAYRTSSSSSTSEDGAGTYAYVTFSGAVRSSVNSQNRIQSTVCKYSGSISGTATNGGHYALSDTQTVTFTLTVRDKVTSSTASVTIATASYSLDLYDDGSGTVGVGLGTVAYGGTITTNLDFRSATGMVRYHISDVSNEEVEAQDSSLTSSSSDGDWFKALLKAICVKYPNSQMVRFVGRINPNSQRNYEVTIYDTSILRNGLPQYSYGLYHAYGGGFRFFGTNDGTYYYWEGVAKAESANTATSATNADNATNATNATNAKNSTYLTPTQLTNENLNDIKESTRYYYAIGGNSVTNNPISGSSFGLVVFRNAGGYRVQHLTSQNGEEFTRHYNGSSWTAWKQFECWHTLWTGTKQGGTSAFTVSGMASYDRIRIYAVVVGDLLVNWEVDVGKLTTTEQCINYGVPNYISNPGGWYMTIANVYATTTQIRVANFYNVRVDGVSSHSTTQNGSGSYYVYRIDGIL